MYKQSLENRHKTAMCHLQTYIDLLLFQDSQISSENDLGEVKDTGPSQHKVLRLLSPE